MKRISINLLSLILLKSFAFGEQTALDGASAFVATVSHDALAIGKDKFIFLSAGNPLEENNFTKKLQKEASPIKEIGFIEVKKSLSLFNSFNSFKEIAWENGNREDLPLFQSEGLTYLSAEDFHLKDNLHFEDEDESGDFGIEFLAHDGEERWNHEFNEIAFSPNTSHWLKHHYENVNNEEDAENLLSDSHPDKSLRTEEGGGSSSQLIETEQNSLCYVSQSPVTNQEYLKFLKETECPPPQHWIGGKFPSGEENAPVTNLRYEEALNYLTWIGKRLPTYEELEKADSVLLHPNKIQEWTCSSYLSKEADSESSPEQYQRIYSGEKDKIFLLKPEKASLAVGFRWAQQ